MRWYPSMHCRSPGPHPGGGSWGVWPGGVSRPTPRGKLRSLAWGVSRPTPRGKLRGQAWGSPGPRWGSLQAHTWGVSPGPHPGGSQAHTQWGGIPACTEADTPPQQMATAVGSTHPSGMHSCSYRIPFDSQLQILQAWVLTTRWLKLTLVVVLYQGLACNAFEGYSWDLRWNRPFVLKFSCLVHLWCYICFTFDLNLLKIRLK